MTRKFAVFELEEDEIPTHPWIVFVIRQVRVKAQTVCCVGEVIAIILDDDFKGFAVMRDAGKCDLLNQFGHSASAARDILNHSQTKLLQI